MKSLYILLLAIAISTVSCRTKEGAPGPAGQSNLNQQGSVTGTITYSINNGTSNTSTVPFSYTYFESLNDNKFYYDDSDGDYYEISFKRRDSKDNNNYFNVDCYGYGTNGLEDDPSSANIYFSFVTVINNQLFEFSGSNGIITNVNLDPTTGRLTFDYTNDSVEFDNGTASVSVKIDVTLNRSANYISAR